MCVIAPELKFLRVCIDCEEFSPDIDPGLSGSFSDPALKLYERWILYFCASLNGTFRSPLQTDSAMVPDMNFDPLMQRADGLRPQAFGYSLDVLGFNQIEHGFGCFFDWRLCVYSDVAWNCHDHTYGTCERVSVH